MDSKCIQKLLASTQGGKTPYVKLSQLITSVQLGKLIVNNSPEITIKAESQDPCTLCDDIASDKRVYKLDAEIAKEYFTTEYPELCRWSAYCEICATSIAGIIGICEQLSEAKELLSALTIGVKAALLLKKERIVTDGNTSTGSKVHSTSSKHTDKDIQSPATITNEQEFALESSETTHPLLRKTGEDIMQPLVTLVPEISNNRNFSQILRPRIQDLISAVHPKSKLKNTSSKDAESEPVTGFVVKEEELSDSVPEMNKESNLPGLTELVPRQKFCRNVQVRKNPKYISRQKFCYFCGQGSIRFDRLSQHMTKHTRERPFKCPTCDSCFVAAQCLKNHIRARHLRERKLKRSLLNDYQKTTCQTCRRRFRSRILFNCHSHRSDGSITFTCSYGNCKKEFQKSSTLMRHYLVCKNNTPRRLKKYGIPSCYFCSKEFQDHHKLERHIKKHTEERPFICNVVNCRKDFTTLESLKQHAKRNHKTRKLSFLPNVRVGANNRVELYKRGNGCYI